MVRFDEDEITCDFCDFKGKLTIERNKMDTGPGIPQGPFFGRVDIDSSMKYKKYILICPNCKALIGAK